MSLQISNQYNNNNQNGEKKKSNFRVGKIYGADGTIDIGVWNSDKGGCYAIMSIKAAVGKDPSTGGNVYEQKMSGELPSICMNLSKIRVFLEAVKDQDPGTLNTVIDTERGAKLTIVGSGSSVKLTIDNQKTGTRTVTLNASPAGYTNIHADFKNLVDMIDICFKKAIRSKLDPDEFSMAFADDPSNGGDTPF